MDLVENSLRSPARPRGILIRRANLITLGVIAALGLATLLRFDPHLINPDLTSWLGLFFIYVLPGFLLLRILYPDSSHLGIAALPTVLILSMALWAIPAGMVQFLHLGWIEFENAFIIILWLLGSGFVWRQLQARSVRTWSTAERPAANQTRSLSLRTVAPELILIALGLVVAVVVHNGPRDGDDWTYLTIAQQLIKLESFRPVVSYDARLGLRYTFQVWIFLQAFAARWVGADVVSLVRDILPTVIAPLSLFGLYGWAKEFTGKWWGGWVAILFQMAIYVTAAAQEGWGHGFFARSAEDKFIAWLLILPITLIFFWRYMATGAWADLIAYGLTILASVFIHPIGLVQLVLILGGFALLNLLFKNRDALQRSISLKRWALTTLWIVPGMIVPLGIRFVTSANYYSLDTPDVAGYLRLSRDRLVIEPPLFYVAHPDLIAHPLILFAIALLPLMLPALRKDRRAQFLWGATLLPLALVFNPFSAWLLGQIITPWQLWRLTWVLPVSLVVAYLLTRREYSPLRVSVNAWKSKLVAWRPTSAYFFVGVGVVAALFFGQFDINRSLTVIAKPHALAPDVQDLLHALPRTLARPSSILLPRKLSRLATAYSANAVLLSAGIHQRRDLLNADLEQFYASDHYTEWMINFLNYHQVDFFVYKRNSAVVTALRARPASFAITYSNHSYVLVQVKQKPIPDELDLTSRFQHELSLASVVVTSSSKEAAYGE